MDESGTKPDSNMIIIGAHDAQSIIKGIYLCAFVYALSYNIILIYIILLIYIGKRKKEWKRETSEREKEREEIKIK